MLKATRLNYLPKKYRTVAVKGLEAILSRIDDKGLLQQVSGGTCVGADLDYYRQISVGPQTYGQSLALLLLLEALKMDIL